MFEGDDRLFRIFGAHENSPEWNDWRWQYKNRITDVEKLACVLELSEAEKNNISSCLAKFRMAITPYYVALMNPHDPCDPVRMQAVPSVSELNISSWEMQDPLNEENSSPVKHIVHRYPDRVLFLLTKCCAMYCRHCSRRRLVGEEDTPLTSKEIADAIDYIRKTPQIRDVLISGGDPLTLSDGQLDRILSELRSIAHVDTIRIGTRVPVTMPMRVTESLLCVLKKHHPIWMNTHFNHPAELTEAAVQACAKIIDAGIPLGNQSVLLRGINNNTNIMKELLLKLIKTRIRPYYLYQCDLNEGLEHFRTDVRTGMNMIQALTGNISGYAIPKFVIDAPGGGGKIPINPEYIVSMDHEKIVMKNYLGEIYEYPQPDNTES